MNLLIDPVFTIAGEGARISLCDVLARLGRAQDVPLAALRPHQAPAWHAFTVQLATMALQRAGLVEPPDAAQAWAPLLRALAGEGGEDAFTLVTPADRPAFLQAPAPDFDAGAFSKTIAAPDALDMLVTAKNHDLKAARMLRAAPEDWAFALMSVQTQEGVLGRGNYGIARMNGGYASRPFIGLARADAPAARFRDDVLQLLAQHNKLRRASPFTGGLGLIWLTPWDGERGLRLDEIDPLAIEICRRVRLVRNANGGLVARVGNSKAARIIGASELKGATGDPWTPIHAGESRALNVSAEGFGWRRVNALLFSAGKDQWKPALLAKPRRGPDGAYDLLLEAVARGQGKTEGFHRRAVRVPPHGRAVLDPEAEEHRDWAQAAAKHADDAGAMANRVLKPALVIAFTKGAEAVNFEAREANALAGQWLADRFDPAVDARFFEALIGQPDDSFEDKRAAWRQALSDFAESVLDAAIEAGARSSARDWRAQSRARSLFENARAKHFEEFRRKRPADPSEEERADHV